MGGQNGSLFHTTPKPGSGHCYIVPFVYPRPKTIEELICKSKESGAGVVGVTVRDLFMGYKMARLFQHFYNQLISLKKEKPLKLLREILRKMTSFIHRAKLRKPVFFSNQMILQTMSGAV